MYVEIDWMLAETRDLDVHQTVTRPHRPRTIERLSIVPRHSYQNQIFIEKKSMQWDEIFWLLHYSFLLFVSYFSNTKTAISH